MASEKTSVALIEIADDEDGMRLDRWFKAHFPHVKFGALQKLLRSGQVRLDGRRVKSNTRLQAGQVMRVPPLSQSLAKQREGEAPLSQQEQDYIRSLVLHEDQSVLVLNKPSGLAVQGGSKTTNHIDRLLTAFGEGEMKPRLVHRLDRDTSGLLLIAKSRKAASRLGEVFRTRSARKIYWALVAGVPRPHQGEISAFLRKYPSPEGEKVEVCDQGDKGAQHSHSYYSVIDHAGQKFAWVSLKPVTGRTHQLRVHMAELGTPIWGDPKYFYSNEAFECSDIDNGELGPGLHLHARRLVIPHPEGGQLDLTAPLPEHMIKSWQALGFDAARYDKMREDDLD